MKKHGNGKLIYEESSYKVEYKGEWAEDLENGYGRVKYKNGD